MSHSRHMLAAQPARVCVPQCGGEFMGIIDQEPVLADCYGVPSFFITDIVAESAGGGCVRLYGCVKQRGVLVPQYQVVMPHTAVLTCSRIASAAALAALKEEMVGAVAH